MMQYFYEGNGGVRAFDDGEDAAQYLGEEWTRGGEPVALSLPVVASVLSPLAFLDRFNDGEVAAIRAAAVSVTAVGVWLYRFERASQIDVSDARTIAGVQGLEAAGLLASGRASEILAAA